MPSRIGLPILTQLVWFLIADTILVAAEPLRLRVMSYNIHHAENGEGQIDLNGIAQVIRQATPDLVSLQEVDQKAQRSGGVDQAAELGKQTGMHVAFGGNLALQGGQYGNAVLSRHPLRKSSNHALPRLDEGEPRGVLRTQIDWPGISRPLVFAATHFDHRPADRERRESVKALPELLHLDSETPALLAGDLNDVPRSVTLKALEKDWRRVNDDPIPTFPVGKPAIQIDHILFRPAERWKVIEVKALKGSFVSDHRPLLAILKWIPEEKP